MLNLFVLYDLFNGLRLGFLDLLVLISVFLGIFIIITKNPVISVLFLMLLFSGIACYLALIGVKFIGLSYLLVYVGAVSILFLFILMLINIRISELINDTNNNTPLALVAIVSLVILFTVVTPDINYNTSFLQPDVYAYTEPESIDYITSIHWDDNIVDITDITCIGNTMYTNYSIWLLITSIILLLAMVGAIVITLKKLH